MRNAANLEVIDVLSDTEWLSTAQVAGKTRLHADMVRDSLHALNNTWVIDRKDGRTVNGGHGYYWRRRKR